MTTPRPTLFVGRGVYYALNDKDSQRLLEAVDDETVVLIIQEDLEDRWDKEWLQETQKTWDAIHRCLTDGTLECKGKSPLEKFVLGGRQLHRGASYVVSYLAPKEVAEMAEAVRSITPDWFRERFYSLKKRFLWFEFTIYDGPIDEGSFGRIWASFNKVRQFFGKTAAAGRSMVFTLER